ncbi:putative cytochrome P450 94B3-like [Iris pallida]|uniref:noroxomaritidine synthase n=1 Tax=Iris pallida TaxID=29817 RepID=A0AAX6GMV3_IRIPA|nr:putative cytochrome P450 94B3-like [Iris pallida]KAJ6839733.1 putative cytochrome P450 94B3-like [Iris pallida]
MWSTSSRPTSATTPRAPATSPRSRTCSAAASSTPTATTGGRSASWPARGSTPRPSARSCSTPSAPKSRTACCRSCRRRRRAESAVVDLQDVLERFAFDNVCKVAFDVDPGRLSSRGGSGEGDAFACSYEAATAIVVGRFKTPRLLWSLRRLLGLGRERALKRELAVLKDFAAKVVNEKRRDHAIGTGGGRDLLSMVMAEGDFSDEFLRDLVLNYVLAGRDTTSSAMSWFFWLVSSRPEVGRRIVGETESVRARHGSSAGSMFTLEELREMSYLHAALSEAMRLYPPVALETRDCAEGDVLPDGTEVGKGVIVMHSPYAMGRMESIWGEDCGEFRPERWLDPDGVFQPRSPYEYPVFHGGPRMCLGKDMAYIQMKAVVASVMERFVGMWSRRGGRGRGSRSRSSAWCSG